MYRTMIMAAAAVSMGVAAWSSNASAQVGVEIYTDPPATYDSYSRYPGYYGYGPPRYGYERRDYAPGVEVGVDYPHGRGGCGTYRYWNGRECVDARYR